MNVPQLRFKGFNEEWKNKKLKDIAELSDGDWIEAEHIASQGEYRIIQTGNIGIGNFINNNKKYLPLNDFNILKANEIYPNDILISRLADPAGRTIITPDINHKMVTVVDVAIMRPNNNYNSYFLMSCLNSKEQLQRISALTTGSTRKRISRKNLERIVIKLPTLSEQQKIGTFFSKLDDLITKQTHKVTLLKQLKQGYLQKLFPQAGQTTPQLRFKGFNEEWQKVKLLNISKLKTGDKNTEDNINNGKYVFFDRSSEIKHLNTFEYDEETIIYPGEGSNFKPNYFYGKYSLHQRAYSLYNFDNSTINTKYLYYYLSTQGNMFIKYAVGTTVSSLRRSTFEKINILFPDLPEQQKIGSLFAKLDHLIELQNRKLQLLQELKKSYLQKMFI